MAATNHQAPPPPQRRAQARRSITAILDTARTVLRDDPAASMNDIAERAHVHRVTLRRHFPTREALIEQLMLTSVEAFNARLTEAKLDEGNARDALLRGTIAFVDESRGWRVGRYSPLGTLPGGSGPDQLRGRVIALIKRGQREGTIRTDVSPFELYLAWIGLLTTWSSLGGAEQSAEDTAHTVLRIMLPDPQPILALPNTPARLILEGTDGTLRLRLEPPD